jgi:hypothetical protein
MTDEKQRKTAFVCLSTDWHKKASALKLGMAERGLFCDLLSLCGDEKNDGIILEGRWRDVRRTLDRRRRDIWTDTLVNAGLIEFDENRNLHVLNYLDWNTSKAEVEAIKEARSKSGRRGGIKSGQTRRKAAENEANAWKNRSKTEAEVEVEEDIDIKDKSFISRSLDFANEALATTEIEIAPPPMAAKPKEITIQKRDLIFETLAEVCGIDWRGLTSSARGSLNSAVKELKAVGATPDEIRRRAQNYRLDMPLATLTPTALAKHWPRMGELAPNMSPNMAVIMGALAKREGLA